MSFETTLSPGSYLVYEGGNEGEVRDANYRLQRTIAVSGSPLLAQQGDNEIEVSYDGDRGPAPWSRWEFKCHGEPERVRTK